VSFQKKLPKTSPNIPLSKKKTRPTKHSFSFRLHSKVFHSGFFSDCFSIKSNLKPAKNLAPLSLMQKYLTPQKILFIHQK
jgi:hypothetical protein